MSGDDSTSIAWFLKELYTPDYVKDTVYPDNPFFSILEQKTDSNAGGKYWVQPIGIELPQGRSRNFNKAQANVSGNEGRDYLVPYYDDFGVHKISRKAIKQSKGAGEKAFHEAQADGIDKMLKQLVRNKSISLYGTGSGRIGVIATGGISGTTITLSPKASITNFAINQKLVAAANEVTGGLRTGAVEVMTVTARDEDAGTITVDATATGLTQGDSLFVEGDRNLAFPGLAGWIPDTAPTVGNPFLGVDRYVEVVRLAGSRLSAKNLSVVEAVRKMLTKIDRAGGKADAVLMNPTFVEALALELGNRGEFQYVDIKTESPNVLLKGARIMGPKGPVEVVSDHNCPEQRSYVIKKSDWFIPSLGPVPDMWDDHGNFLMWDVGAPGYEVRADVMSALVCKDARNQGVIKWDV